LYVTTFLILKDLLLILNKSRRSLQIITQHPVQSSHQLLRFSRKYA